MKAGRHSAQPRETESDPFEAWIAGSCYKREARMLVVMIGPFPILQVVGGLIGAVCGFAVGRLFSPRRPGMSRLAGQLRTFAALTIMVLGMALGQIIGHLLHTLIG